VQKHKSPKLIQLWQLPQKQVLRPLRVKLRQQTLQ
jgi:hypothetical protein